MIANIMTQKYLIKIFVQIIVQDILKIKHAQIIIYKNVNIIKVFVMINVQKECQMKITIV